MRNNRFLFYLVLVGIAFAVPSLLLKHEPKPGTADNKAAPVPVAHAAPPLLATAAATPPRSETEPLATLETSDFRAVVSGWNGGLKSFTLKDRQFRHDGKPIDVVT